MLTVRFCYPAPFLTKETKDHMEIVKETRKRTIVKAIVYRILSVVAIVILSLLFGASTQSAGLMGLVVVVVGTTIYYIHDRLWLLTGWARDFTGVDNIKRSIIKTIVYRILVMIAGFITVKIVLGSTNSDAVAFTIAQAIINLMFFYILERIFNLISWGKIKHSSQVE